MATPRPVTPEAPFEPSQPPVIEGFSPSVYSTSESFKEKFLRKTRENPMVPIGGSDTGSPSRASPRPTRLGKLVVSRGRCGQMNTAAGMRDLSSPTRGQTRIPCIGSSES
ncbi:HIG1 domain family member 2A, mitochondrial isoform X1 [Balaenoptera ricei]|uniref:HIG1 domain family member 2A, mitochondrial isoform X1 n=1 Tax=Balaenoptera ricei TaxID=2746895 RepID=UPI0028BF001B|nr:HIG1 domain family member 2A, mitochondrial isoform X1 [Balaenoptera ricei]